MTYKAAQCLVLEEWCYFVIPSDMDPNTIVVGGRKMSDQVLAQVQSWPDAVKVAYAMDLATAAVAIEFRH